MKKVLLLAVLIALFIDSNAQRRATRRIALIPQPVSIVENNKAGNFILPSTINIIVPNNEEVKKIASLFAAQITPPTGYKTTIKAGNSPLPKSILFLLTTDKTIADEGYKLKVTSAGITLTARKPAGIFYGVQTLLQLLPSGITSTTELDYDEWDIPAVTIEDQPRFGWRGLMLDVSRHFFTVAQVKDYIDQMVKYKFNLLHLGLTNDQGWRIQIKSLPKLTEVGAWRVERTGTFGTLSKPLPGEKATYGGFYTHEDIKELVKYAADRFVNILPEIDVPGHSLAALAS